MSTDLFAGCDLGTVSVKAAVASERTLGGDGLLREVPIGRDLLRGWHLYVSPCRRVRGDPLRAAEDLLEDLRAVLPRDPIVTATGSGGKLLASHLGIAQENEFRALARAVSWLLPDTRQVLEVGGQSARFVRVAPDPAGASTGAGAILDYETNGECAAGTGSFIDQQASRLRYAVEEVGEVALASPRAAKIAGRCSVFAKSDMIHAQQKGAAPPEVLRGLCEAVARNYHANVLRGRLLAGPTAFVGGVARNGAVLRALREVLDLGEDLYVPEAPELWSALGAALARRPRPLPVPPRTARVQECGLTPTPAGSEVARAEPLDLSAVVLLRDHATRCPLPTGSDPVEVYLGVDVGSVSTNLVCANRQGDLIHEIYLRTEGRPVEVVRAGLAEIEELFGPRLRVRGVATTGSGRELVGELLGADAVHDEITAHKTGAFRIAEQYLHGTVDTIFEIGGQDSKYIHLRDGVVVQFTMNEACAAGTGSFLEEQAEQLGVSIVDEFARLGLASRAPVRLGERCTVFMERDVAAYAHRGVDRADLIAGLAYAVVHNYLNRVVRGRPVGEVVFFQGGTAYNDAVAAAFAKVLGRPVVVPPHNGVVGAYGAALLAREKVEALGCETRFRGCRLDRGEHRVRVFTCGGCGNACDVQEFTVDGRKSYWGDKCSERYRREARVPQEPVVPDLARQRAEWLEADYLNGLLEQGERAAVPTGVRIGVPRALHFHAQFPFWGTYLRALGTEVVTSPPTTKALADLGAAAAVAEPCHPVRVAHGHAAVLLDLGVDHVLVPNVVDADGGAGTAYLCPWAQTFPFVLAASPLGERARGRLLIPTVHFRDGLRRAEAELWETFRPFARSRSQHRAAVTLAGRAQEAFRRRVAEAGREALARLRETGRPAVVLVGRPYNLYDPEVNLHVPGKLRSLYGMDVIPMDFLPLDEVEVGDVSDNMYWSYGRRILQAGRLTSREEHLHLIYLTNFKCGPDSYVKQFCEDAAVKPFLVLQFDGHGSDAGTMTRCEAYLDSKGVLRWWQNTKRSGSTSRGCAKAPRDSPSLPSGA